MFEYELTPRDHEMIGLLPEVFGITSGCAPIAQGQLSKSELMGWHAKAFNDDKNYPKGEYVFFSTPYLVPSKIQEMQQELQAVVTKKLADAGINFEGQEFFPPLIGKDFYDKYPRVLTSWQSLEFLQQHNVQVDIVPILQKYETMENAYVDAIRTCRDKVNELSGFPVWEFFEHASMGQRPFITLNVPEGTENAPQSYLPFNSGAMIQEFIQSHNLSFMKYEEHEGVRGDYPDASLVIKAENLVDLQQNIATLEKIGPEFRAMTSSMLLRATPLSALARLTYGAFMTFFKEAGEITMGEAQRAQGGIEADKGLKFFMKQAPQFLTVEIMIDDIVIQKNKAAVPQLQKFLADQLVILGDLIPALAPVIASKAGNNPQPQGQGVSLTL